MRKEFTCIICPQSCRLTVYKDGDSIVVEGNNCKRGKTFGENEFTNPMRILTTTVKLKGSYLNRLPVISQEEIPKTKIFECVKELYKITVEAPVARGQVIMENICGTGVNIVASRSVKKT